LPHLRIKAMSIHEKSRSPKPKHDCAAKMQHKRNEHGGFYGV